MTIIVQGMDMPEGCFVCSLKKFNRDDLNYYCPYIKDKAKVSSYFPGTRRHPDCPCKEVPIPHGRLGDLDHLKECIDYVTDDCTCPLHIAAELYQYMDDAPTIIEAED